VQPTYGLTDEQVESMILESFDYAEDDFVKRQVIEARNEAETILSALDKGRRSDGWSRLGVDEKVLIDECESVLRTDMATEDYKNIRTAIDALNKATMRLAELMMDSAVTSALKGKDMATTDMGEGPSAPHPFAPAEFEK
jgi:molecular chaperone DnaK (HSP70)